jgi:hypothetical protein
MIRDGASLEEVMASLSKTFEDEASDAANTTAGKFKTLKNSLNEAKEELGKLLLPALEKLVKVIEEKVLPYMDKLIKKFKEDGLSGAIKMATADLAKFITKLDGTQGTVFDFALALGVMFAGFKLFGLIGSITTLVGSFGAALGSLGGYLGGAFAVSAGFAAATLGLVFVNLMVLISALRDNEFRPVFLEYLANIGKLILNIFIAIYKAMEAIINLAPRLVNALLPGNPVDLLDTAPDFLEFGSGAGDPVPATPRARRQSVPDISGSSSTGRGQGGVSVTVNTGVGDPVAIGRAVSQVLDTYNRRAS